MAVRVTPERRDGPGVSYIPDGRFLGSAPTINSVKEVLSYQWESMTVY